MKKNDFGESYVIRDGSLEATVTISKLEGDVVPLYALHAPQWGTGTAAFTEDLKARLLKKVTISSQEALNIKMAEDLRAKFITLGKQMIRESLPQMSEAELDGMARMITYEMLGLGNIELLLKDDLIEEVCVNGAGIPAWVYHRKYGWMKTNLVIPTESQIWNYSSAIARNVGRQINVQSPLLDAYLPTGDRVNATLTPISYFGNTITIRKFARKPWTITDYIKSKTLSSDVAALIWLAIQYEANILVSGGTGAGKTSLLNVLSMFIPPNQRVLSIEQTREMTFPAHLQWIPMVVREPTSEGTGEVSMLTLMVNSLRMRPDRIIVGEIRRAEEAQVLFEAMHTGHAVYATLHAETVGETVRRLINPPLNIPTVMMESLHMIVSMYRDRRKNIRRLFEVGELVQSDREGIKENILYRWRPYKDEVMPSEKSVRLMDSIKMRTNMDDDAIKQDLKDKQDVLDYLVKNGVTDINDVGRIISAYYDNPEELVGKVRKK